MTRSAFFVEQTLPGKFLYHLGVYVQTCAQIEHFACCAICKLEGISDGSEIWVKRHDELRKLPTRELITCLSKTSEKEIASDPEKSNFRKICEWAHRYLDDRHLAVHGRFTFDTEKNRFFVEAAPKDSLKNLPISA